MKPLWTKRRPSVATIRPDAAKKYTAQGIAMLSGSAVSTASCIAAKSDEGFSVLVWCNAGLTSSPCYSAY